MVVVVYPVVLQQTFKWDAMRVARDLSHVRLGIEQFTLDTRDHPLRLSQLVTHPLAGEARLASRVDPAAVFSTAESQRWNGPYLGNDLVEDLADELGIRTGFDGLVLNGLVCTSLSGDFSACGEGTYVGVVVTDLREWQFDLVNSIVDAQEADLTLEQAQQQGRLIFLETEIGVEEGTSPGWLVYLAVPYIAD